MGLGLPSSDKQWLLSIEWSVQQTAELVLKLLTDLKPVQLEQRRSLTPSSKTDRASAFCSQRIGLCTKAVNCSDLWEFSLSCENESKLQKIFLGRNGAFWCIYAHCFCSKVGDICVSVFIRKSKKDPSFVSPVNMSMSQQILSCSSRL